MRSSPQGERRSVDRGTCGPGIQPRKKLAPGRRRCKEKRKAPPGASISRDAAGSRAVRDPVHVRKHPAREPGGPVLARSGWSCGTRREVQGRTPTMNEHGKSDSPAVLMKSPNNTGQPVTEEAEGSDRIASQAGGLSTGFTGFGIVRRIAPVDLSATLRD